VSGIIRAWVMNGERLPLEEIPRDVPKEIPSLITECWDQNADKRPAFTGKEYVV